MPVERIEPKSEQEWLEMRAKDLTSTEVSALFGISPYITNFELWHRKKNQQIADFIQSDRMKWGTRLQDTIAKGIAEDEGWKIRRMDEYMRDPELRLGASFDFSIEGDELGLLEIKNVDSLIYKEGWEKDDEGNLEAPPHIEMQLQQQMLVADRKFGYIGALVGGNTVSLIKRERDEEICQAIKDKVAAFWKSIDDNEEPTPDFEKDASFISKLCRYAEPGKMMSLEGDEGFKNIAVKHNELGKRIKALEKQREACKAQMLMQIGDAEKCIGDGYTISAGLIGPVQISYERKGYRAFRINWPRKKKGE